MMAYALMSYRPPSSMFVNPTRIAILRATRRTLVTSAMGH